MKLKKIAVLSCALSMAFALVSCGDSDSSSTKEKAPITTEAETTAATTTVAEVTTTATAEATTTATTEATTTEATVATTESTTEKETTTESDVKIVKSGECGDKGDNVTFALDENGLLTISGEGKMHDYFGDEVPEYKEESLKKLKFIKGVTSVGNSAFANCKGLRVVRLGNVKSIESYAFAGCTSLKDIKIPDSVTSIGTRSFSNCESIKELTIPNSVVSFGDEAFNNCKNLTIKCYEGSEAEKYAKDNNLKYEIIK